jgi:hypothetical protein
MIHMPSSTLFPNKAKLGPNRQSVALLQTKGPYSHIPSLIR